MWSRKGCPWGVGRGGEGGGGLVQVLETGSAEQGLCSAHARLPVPVRTRAEHQRSRTQALLGAGFGSSGRQ